MENNQANFGDVTRQQVDVIQQRQPRHDQEQLMLLIHAHKCRIREGQQNNGINCCSVNHCQAMKNVLSHMSSCHAGKNCIVPHCSSSSALIHHWENCARGDCALCVPIKRKWMNGPSQENLATMNQQVDTPNSVQSHNIGNAPQQMQIGASNVSNAPHISKILGVVDSLGEILEHLQVHEGLEIEQAMPKEWHKSVTQDQRAYFVQKLVQGIFPNPSPETMLDSRMDNLVAFARKVEGDLYELANSRSEYCFLLSTKLRRIQRELEEKRKLAQPQLGQASQS